MTNPSNHLDLIRDLAARGHDLNAIQKALAEAGCPMKFIDLRFFLLDHAIEIASCEPEPVAPAAADETVTPDDAGEPQSSEPASPCAPLVKVVFDELQIPGMMISGKAHFASGIRGAWGFDQMGQFSWGELSGTPSEHEMLSFQHELSALLSRGA